MEDGRLGKYVISGILGKGAMGTVYDAHDPIIDRRVAIKTLTLPDAGDTETQEELARFKREAQAAGRLTHPNIVGVFDYGETAKLAYIVMEFVGGPSLKSLLDKNERFPTGETVRIMEALLAGLQFSHERGVVHRDIKPANVMLTLDGQVKIADFGIARIESSSMTQAGTIMGTPAYMSPEQFMGQTVDARTDIYSSGVLLYQMLTGERPFEGSMTAIMHKVLNVAPPNPSELSVTAPQMLDVVVARAMAKRPEQRYATAAEFAQALRAAALGQTVAAPADDADATMVAPPPAARAAPRPPLSSAPAPTKRNLVPLLAGVSALVLAAGGGGWYWFAGRTPAPTVTADVAPVPTPVPPPTTILPPPAAAPDTPAAGPPLTAGPAPAPTPPSTAPSTAPSTPPSTAPSTPPSAGPIPPAASPPVPLPPVAAPTPPPPPAPPSPAQLRTALQEIAQALPCALIEGSVSESGHVSVGGLVGDDYNAAHRRLVEATARGATVNWQPVVITGPYCRTLDLLRPFTRHFEAEGSDVQLTLKSGLRKLRDEESIVPRFVMPNVAGHAQVSYFTSDGEVAHLFPSDPAKQLDISPLNGRRESIRNGSGKARQFPAGATVSLGDPATCSGCAADVAGWQVGKPFGFDLVVVVTSAQPLFRQPRPPGETTEAYLRDLEAALAGAKHRGDRVTARAIAVETEPR